MSCAWRSPLGKPRASFDAERLIDQRFAGLLALSPVGVEFKGGWQHTQIRGPC